MDARTSPPKEVAGFDPIATAGDCWYDHEAAQKAVTFISNLELTKGKWAGEKFKLEPWQEDYIRSLFGWKRPNGSRRFRTSFLFLPRKNGKSQLAAAIAIYVLFCDAEAEAQCYCAASDREQASLVFRAAASMIRKNKTLDTRCKITETHRRAIYKDSFMRAIPANEGGSHGFDSHLIVGDELHTWPNRDFYDTLHTSTGAREQPLEVYITTAGHDKQSICYEIYERAKAIRDGKIEDPSFLPAIYEAEADDDWKEPETWAKANPNLGVSVNYDYIEAECKKAIENPGYENTFRRLHLNQWTSQDIRWLPMDKWQAGNVSNDIIEPGSEVWIGLDLSSVRDFTAAVVVQKVGEGIRCFGHYWLPEKRIEFLSKKHNISVDQWVKDGWITSVPNENIEYSPIVDWMTEAAEKYQVQSVGYDPHAANFIEQEISSNGILAVKKIQSANVMGPPAQELERLVNNSLVDCCGDPVLEWMAENIDITKDAQGRIQMVKYRKKVRNHIDGIVALVMGLDESMAQATTGIFGDEWNDN